MYCTTGNLATLASDPEADPKVAPSCGAAASAAPIHPTFLTQSGNVFHFASPAHSILTIEDIAHSLAHLCRFGGHTSSFYSFAQHGVMVSRLVPHSDALAALCHDAPKAVLGAVQTSLKPLLPDYRAIEARVLEAVHQRLHLPYPPPASIRPAALIVRATERRDLLPEHHQEWPELAGVRPLAEHIVPLSAEAAREAFLARYHELTAQRTRLCLV